MDSFFILAALVATAVIAGVGIDHAEPILRARVIETQPPIQPLDPSRRIPVPNRDLFRCPAYVKVRMDVEVSQMVSSWKSILLKPVVGGESKSKG